MTWKRFRLSRILGRRSEMFSSRRNFKNVRHHSRHQKRTTWAHWCRVLFFYCGFPNNPSLASPHPHVHYSNGNLSCFENPRHLIIYGYVYWVRFVLAVSNSLSCYSWRRLQNPDIFSRPISEDERSWSCRAVSLCFVFLCGYTEQYLQLFILKACLSLPPLRPNKC